MGVGTGTLGTASLPGRGENMDLPTGHLGSDAPQTATYCQVTARMGGQRQARPPASGCAEGAGGACKQRLPLRTPHPRTAGVWLSLPHPGQAHARLRAAPPTLQNADITGLGHWPPAQRAEPGGDPVSGWGEGRVRLPTLWASGWSHFSYQSRSWGLSARHPSPREAVGRDWGEPRG